jgi:hypothetical protein
MQLLTEAPPITMNARDGVVAEIQLVQGREAIQGAAVHFHQAVGLQVPTMTATHRLKRGLSFIRQTANRKPPCTRHQGHQRGGNGLGRESVYAGTWAVGRTQPE